MTKRERKKMRKMFELLDSGYELEVAMEEAGVKVMELGRWFEEGDEEFMQLWKVWRRGRAAVAEGALHGRAAKGSVAAAKAVLAAVEPEAWLERLKVEQAIRVEEMQERRLVVRVQWELDEKDRRMLEKVAGVPMLPAAKEGTIDAEVIEESERSEDNVAERE